ncbi:MAG: hypothetical protein KJ006_12815, partial [Thermoleophilia bacterium]|nr:hypothetical protein [Thermoleophilia bacterium]
PATAPAAGAAGFFEERAWAPGPAALRAGEAARLGPRVTAVAQESRGQARNRAVALERLRIRLAGAAAPGKRRRPTGPGRAARERRLADKRRRSERKRERRRPSGDDW